MEVINASILNFDTLKLAGLTLSQLAIGGMIGFLIGFAVKHVLKLILIVFGVLFVLFIYLDYTGIITVNYDKLKDTLQHASLLDLNLNNVQDVIPFLQGLLLSTPTMLGVGAGLVLGVMKS